MDLAVQEIERCRCHLVDCAAGVLKRNNAIVELQEPVAQRLLDDEVRQILNGREDVVEQHPVSVQRS